jgi:hypothetical protein
MGTRADFYVGKGKNAQWIGSIAWDGYRSGIDDAVIKATTEDDFCAAVTRFFVDRDDVTLPVRGWPWPWNTSATTDCSYWFFDGHVWDEIGGKYLSCQLDWPETDEAYEAAKRDGEPIDFPVFNLGGSAEPGSKRSGIIVIGL